MIIKKFQGKTEEEALEAAKKELGSNVVVLNVKSVKRKGLFSFLKPQLTEITVALEEETEKKDYEAAGPISSVEARSITEALGKIAPIVEREEAKKSENVVSDSKIDERLNNIENIIEEKVLSGTKSEEPAEEIPEEKENDELKCFFELLEKTMIDNEVDTDYAKAIIDETKKVTKNGTPIDVVLAGIYQKMILKFGKASPITPSEHGPKTVFFVGPTGVGKTTTIAKIASRFSVELKKKVALLTADTYRIAAAEQLRTYANILEVPFRIIYTIEEIESALKDFAGFDYVFVDTAGHSHQNEEQKSVMGSFIHSVDNSVDKEVYLVVSATTKYRDLKSIADAYSKITDYKLIFTKLDETTALGNLLNLKLYTGADLSYVTCGQNVPDDIENFNAQKTVKNLLGGRN